MTFLSDFGDMGAAAKNYAGVDKANEWITAARALAPRLAERVEDHDQDGTFTHERHGPMAIWRHPAPAELADGGIEAYA